MKDNYKNMHLCKIHISENVVNVNTIAPTPFKHYYHSLYYQWLCLLVILDKLAVKEGSIRQDEDYACFLSLIKL